MSRQHARPTKGAIGGLGQIEQFPEHLWHEKFGGWLRDVKAAYSVTSDEPSLYPTPQAAQRKDSDSEYDRLCPGWRCLRRSAGGSDQHWASSSKWVAVMHKDYCGHIKEM